MKEKALDNKCPNCGASINFDIKRQLWHCEYCESNFTLEELNKRSSNASSEENNKVRKTMDVDEYSCKNCGAVVMALKNTASTFCVYCGNTAILKNNLTGIYAPDYLIPFKNTKEEIILNFKNLQKGRPLMPKLFNDPKNIEKITGIYIPFWLFDITVSGKAEFKGTRISSWRRGDYQYTKTDIYNLIREADLSFDRIPADGSSRFANDLMQSLEPFSYEKLKKYNHAYLSGFLAERYDVLEKDSLIEAENRALNSTLNEMKNTCMGYASVTESKNDLLTKARETDYVLLPVWMLNIKYGNKTYTFAMNGETGKMVGNIPVHKGKALIMWLSVFLGTFIILSIGWMVLK